jgi:transposase
MVPTHHSGYHTCSIFSLFRQAAMRHFEFSAEVLDIVRHERYHHPHPRVQQKMEVIWLKSQGLTHDTIARLAGLSRRSVQRYLDEYHEGGIDALYELRWEGKHCPLDDYRTSLEEYFIEHPPRTTREARDAIERLTGIRRSLTQVRAFLKKNSVSPGGRRERFRGKRTPMSRRSS